MSAPMDGKLFQGYFNNCPLVHIPGGNHHVEIRYLAKALPSFVVVAASIVINIHENDEPGHILVFLLVFLHGKDGIEEVCRLVRLRTRDLEVFPLYSALSVSDQTLALGSFGPNRKCIVATNIADTSMTIDNVVYFIDSGLSKRLRYNPRLRLNILDVLPVSQASARQRARRAGRTRDGVCYRLYTKENYDRLPSLTEPAIRCVSVDSVILKLVAAGYRKTIDFDWIDAPHSESISRTAQDLHDWYALTDNRSWNARY